jgi:hypothetical protein
MTVYGLPSRWICRPTIAESPLEEAPRKHHRVSTRMIFALRKCAPDHRLHSEQRKQVPAPAARLHHFRQFPLLSCQVRLPVAPCCHVLKAMSLCAPVVIVAGSDGVVVEALGIVLGIAKMLIDHHQPVGIAERKRSQQNRPHHREHRCRRADAQRHDDDSDHRKSRRPKQRADADPLIAKQILQRVPTPDGTSLLRKKTRIAKRPQCRIPRLFRRHALLPLFLFLHIKVRSQFPLNIPIPFPDLPRYALPPHVSSP